MKQKKLSSLNEFIISKKEIKRRKKAYTVLVMSLFFSSIIFGINFILSNILTGILTGTIFLIFLIISRILTFRSLDYYSSTKIFLKDSFLLKEIKNVSEKYIYKDIVKVRIKRTSKKYLREIRILLNSGKRLSINGLSDFNNFEQKFLEKLEKKVLITELKEPLDFDHVFFYPIFGILLSLGCFSLFRLIMNLDYSMNLILYYSFIVYNFLMAVYLFLKRPISSTFGKKSEKIDIISAILLLIINLFLCFR